MVASYTFNRLSYINKRCYYQTIDCSTSPDAVITVTGGGKELYLYCSKGADHQLLQVPLSGPTFTYTVTAANADTYTTLSLRMQMLLVLLL
jgi:hypothetical protein